MTERTIRLVRNGRAVGRGDTVDPGLDDGGRRQAAEVARRLATGATVIVSSPRRRCREAAEILSGVSGLPVDIVPALSELPAPPDVDVGDRADWVRSVMERDWTSLDARLVGYRDGVLEVVRRLPDGAVVFSHLAAINVVIGACLGDERVLIRRLAHGSVTTVTVHDRGMRLVLAPPAGDSRAP